MTQATITVHPSNGDTVRLAITGEIDLSNAARVEDQILDAVDNQHIEVELDLRTLNYIDSAGLRILFTLATRLEISQIALALLVAPSSHTWRVLDITGMASMATLRAG